MKVKILVATQGGTADLCAQEMVDVLEDRGYEADTTYEDTFNFAGEKFDAILSECGAERVIERHIHDANSGALAEDEAIEWIEGWLGALEAKAAA